jgi:uncharacterized integral membrane protein
MATSVLLGLLLLILILILILIHTGDSGSVYPVH